MSKNISEYHNKVILVTGGTGSIGSEIVRQLLKKNPKQIRIYSRDESKHYFLEKEINEKNSSKIDIKYLIGDIRDKERLEKAMRDVDIVFHAAALKHVPYCEFNPFEAIKTNVYATQHIIDLAIENNIEKVIAISTDKAVYPNNIMGITKLLMERMIISSRHYVSRSRKTKFSVVRFGNVINSRGSVIPLWIEQISKGLPVTITDKRMRRYFMSIPEAVSLVFYAASIMRGEEIFVLKMTEEKIIDLAKRVIKQYSKGKKIKIKVIGIRDREKLTERLYTEEEEVYMVDNGAFNIILPNKEIVQDRKDYYKKVSLGEKTNSIIHENTGLDSSVIN